MAVPVRCVFRCVGLGGEGGGGGEESGLAEWEPITSQQNVRLLASWRDGCFEENETRIKG